MMYYSSEERAGSRAGSERTGRRGGGYSRQIDCAAGEPRGEPEAGLTGRGRGTPERDPRLRERGGEVD